MGLYIEMSKFFSHILRRYFEVKHLKKDIHFTSFLVSNDTRDRNIIIESILCQDLDDKIFLGENKSFKVFISPSMYISPQLYTVLISNARVSKYVYDLDKKTFVYDNWTPVIPYTTLISLSQFLKQKFKYTHLQKNSVKLFLTNSPNYYHFVIDQVIPLFNSAQNILKRNQKITIISSGNLKKKFQRDLLNISLSNFELIELNTNSTTVIKNLIIPSRIRDKFNYNITAIENFTRFVTREKKNQTKLKLYITRNEAKTRRVVNEKQLFEKLKLYGFQILNLSILKIEEQINAFANAEIIISPHGAGNTNIIFSKNAHLIELLPFDQNRLGHYCNLTAITGNFYYSVLGNKLYNNDCFEVEVKEIEDLVRNILKYK